MNNDDLDRLKSSDTTMDEKCNRDASEAAAVLTNLGISVSQVSKADEREEKFVIPQRFTRSGRKRAVSFPLKVCMFISSHQLVSQLSLLPSAHRFSFSAVDESAFQQRVWTHHSMDAKWEVVRCTQARGFCCGDSARPLQVGQVLFVYSQVAPLGIYETLQGRGIWCILPQRLSKRSYRSSRKYGMREGRGTNYCSEQE
jgi:hypothetical protein